MSSKYWKNRWIEALVQNGVERSVAEKAYVETYKDEPADYAKSPEIQAFLMAKVPASQARQSA
ncbi:hypothetical protein GCM10008066_17960 [Oxalicibacterium faecigallinarum]|uniref:Uncharacterized protein n=2 Tax=Oxalicibacterium faecigallinarum TaxID=573741 RepID=A0A8J3AY87_9BURK|nr:hypothetical protein GCM10008066_17960 [Oxalicibacterium faecigallinarum]